MAETRFRIRNLIGCILILLAYGSYAVAEERDPIKWASAMRAFETADATCPPPQNGIVFTGSSSIAIWRTIREDLAPLSVINRGFGGSTMTDAIYWLDSIVLKYNPRAVVIYEGDNDIALGAKAEDVLAGFEALVSRIHAASPDIRIYFIAIKPSISRQALQPEMDRANRLVKDFCEQHSRLHFIDVASPLLQRMRQSGGEIFEADQLHLNTAGYRVWTSIIKPILLENEGSR